MTTKNFVNVHILISHSPSCLNRDDLNMQKTAVFGGVSRVRISSQSLKRAMRTSEYYQRYFSRSLRTRFLIDSVVAQLLESKVGDIKAIEAGGLVVAALLEGKVKPEDIKKYKRNEDSGRIQHQVVPFSAFEASALKDLILEISNKSEKERIEFAKARFKEVEQNFKKRIDLDVAFSGRMAASDLLYGTDGALAVAHVITTHAVEPQDVDWFTAVDDLTQDEGETGAGHLNTQQFSSGVFYRYASLNLKQLQVNLGLLSDIKSAETVESRQRALDIAAHVLHLMATVVPSAKQQSFAAHNLADFTITSFADQPISLANAFEQPVKRDDRNAGFLTPSIGALSNYWTRMNRAYGLDERAQAFAVEEGLLLSGKPALNSLEAMKEWIRRDGNA